MRKPAPLDLRSLRYLLAIVEEGSFARAAEKLNVTQPALSRSVQALERSLGVKLLDRGRFGVAPTVFGKLVIERGRVLISDAAAIAREIALLGGAESGEISVGVGAYPAEISTGPAAARLLAAKPGMKVRIAIGDWPELTESVLTEKLDLAICEYAGAETNPRLAVEPLPTHQGSLFCRGEHPLAKKTRVTLDAIREFPLVLTAVPERLSALVTAQDNRGRRAFVPAVHVDTFQLARTIVLGSNAIGAAVAQQIDQDVQTRRLRILPIELPWLVTRYGFIYLSGRSLSPSVRAFMAIVREIEAGTPVSPRRRPGSGKDVR